MIVTVVGARPQFVKAAVVSAALAARGVDERLVHTGQHYDERMSEVFFRELGLPGVAANLGVGSGTHASQTGAMMVALERFIMSRDAAVRGVLLYGDTNSTLAGALVAAKLHIPILHVEAGLRSGDMRMPEEVNRVVTDRLSSRWYCPSEEARANLVREGVTADVAVVGDVMLDAFLRFRPLAREAVRWPGDERRRVLLTLHRASNTESAVLGTFLAALAALDGVAIVWPVHPRVREVLAALPVPSCVQLIEPLSYLEMIGALEACDVVVTDSGGLQKEAYWAHKPCVTLREQTEWVETLEGGCNRLVPIGDVAALREALCDTTSRGYRQLYGDGRASLRIAESVGEL